jgi:hypothetical protein
MIVLVPLLLALLRRTRGTRTDSPEARRARVPLPVSRDHDRRLPPRSGESRSALEREVRWKPVTTEDSGRAGGPVMIEGLPPRPCTPATLTGRCT